MQNVKKSIDSKRFTGDIFISSNQISDKKARYVINVSDENVNKPVYKLLINEFIIENKE